MGAGAGVEVFFWPRSIECTRLSPGLAPAIDPLSKVGPHRGGKELDRCATTNRLYIAFQCYQIDYRTESEEDNASKTRE
jgi:hypothetical protein